MNIQPHEITVILGGKNLVYGEDFIVESITNNKKAGKGTLVIRGIGNYGCTKKVTFIISPKNLSL